MSFFGNIFPGSNQSSDKSPFERWSSPSPVISVPAGRLDVFPLHSLSVGSHSVSANLGPSIVIGLGDAGALALHQWLEQTAHYENGVFDNVRVLSLSVSTQKPLPQRWIQVRQIAFVEGSADQNLSPLDAFRQAASIRQFQEWLKSALLNMRDIQVLIVASTAEPEIHLMGPILQILRVFPGSAVSPYLNIVGLLSLSSAKQGRGIPQGERYAALREISRFTFSGWHKTIEIPGRKETVVRSALLDHLFLLDENKFHAQSDKAFNSGLGQALSEMLFFLNHPSSKEFWGMLKNDAAGQFRQEYHQPVAHTVGIKTFFVPLTEMQSYLAARLTHAVLFGERPQDVMDQLVSPKNATVADSVSLETFARRWLVDNGTGAHPIFEWLWNMQPSSQLIVPDVTDSYNDLYALKVSHSLAKFLNEPGDGDKFRTAGLVLRIHVQHFEKILSGFGNDFSPRQDRFANMLRLWMQAAEYLGKSLQKWQNVFTPSPVEDGGGATTRLRLNWQKESQTKDIPPLSSDQTIFDLLRRAQGKSVENLLQTAGGKVRFALTHNSQAPLDEVDKYYKDTIRPEVSHLGMKVGNAFVWVRNRLSWWVRLEMSRDPELLLVCWPSNVNVDASTKPPPEYCYLYEDKHKIVDAVISLATTQISRLTEDLTGDWYTRRLENMAVGLHDTSEEVFLSYDENIASNYANADKRHYYLVGKNKELTGRFIRPMFPYRMPNEVNELDGNDATRFTVLTSRLNIPFSAIQDVNKWYESYNHQSHLHTYPQERLATVYEDLIARSLGEKFILSPDFILALTDGQLVTLFCQALFCKLICVENSDVRHSPFWQVQALQKFAPLELASVSANGLLDAFRAFTLELPNDLNVELNPTRHFHSGRRNEFLASLLNDTRSIRRGEKFKSLQVEFKNGILADWKSRSDLLSRSFAALLQVELEEPVWEGWYS
jgi:hypothetical protein